MQVPARSLRCRWCSVYFPLNHEDFGRCPTCREPTIETPSKPMDENEAYALKRERDFGWYLWEFELL